MRFRNATPVGILAVGTLLMMAVSVFGGGKAVVTVYVATDGLDANPGTLEAPVATVPKAVKLAERQRAPAEIVVRGGTYFLEKRVTVPRSKKDSRLVIRSADSKTAVFDGSVRVGKAEPLPDVPGVYTIKGDFPSDEPPPIWDEATGRHFKKLGGLDSVRNTDCSSVVLDEHTLALRYRDGRSPAEADLRMSRKGLAYGFLIVRDSVTIKDIEFRNFILNTAGTPILIGLGCRFDRENKVTYRKGEMTADTVIDSCVARNCHKGFHVYTGSQNALITGCRMQDSITGVWLSGVDSVVEDCTIVNDPDWLLGKAPDSHRSYEYGVRMYNYCTRATIRRNLIKGFTGGIHCKNGWGAFHIENNTVLYGQTRVDGYGLAMRPNMNKDYHVRYNIFAGFSAPFGDRSSIPPDADIDYNVFWGPEHNCSGVLKGLRDEGVGLHNVYADPLFASPHRDDFRLLPGSPATNIHAKKGAGACAEVPADYRGAPSLRVALAYKKGVQTKAPFPPRQLPPFACYVSTGRAVEVNLAVSSMVQVKTTRFAINNGPGRERGFKAADTFKLPDKDGWHKVGFQVRDANDDWSPERVIHVALRRGGVQLVGDPRVVTSRYGALVSFRTDRYAWGKLEYRDGNEWVESANSKGLPANSDGFPEDYGQFREFSSLPLLAAGIPPDTKHRYRLTVSSSLGSTVKEGTFTLDGRAKIVYVSTAGEDTEAGGSREKPLRTIQFALDRALPGDRVRIMPGVYFGPHILNHGGTADHPLVVEGLYPNTVILDGLREAASCLRLDNAPNVVLRNLNFRWFKSNGVLANNSPAVRVTGCRFRNQYWRTSTWPIGTSVMLWRSPHFTVDHCIFSRSWNGGIVLDESSGGKILHNTVTACAVMLIYWRGWWRPSENITIKYNSLNWNSNQMLNIMQPLDTLRNKCDIDYNNYGTTFKRQEGTSREPWGNYGKSLAKTFGYLPKNREFMYFVDWDQTDAAKSAISRSDRTKVFVNMADWQEFSGQDKHSIFSDPKWVDPEAGRFDVAADSPNLLPDGKVIGALGFLGQVPNMVPEVVITSPSSGQNAKGAITVTADASDHDGTVKKVEFYAGERRIGVAATPPYGATVPGLAAGRHAITARAIDDRGGTAVSDEVTVTVLE